MNKIQYNSPVVITYALISLAALGLGILTEDVSTYYLFSVYKSSYTDPLTYIRIFTHVLGHINFEHYFNNMMLLLLLGPILEEKYGSKILLLTIAATALITGALNVALFDNRLLGASGIVFMFILLSSFANVQKGRVPLTLILVAIIFIGKEIAAGILLSDNVSQITHIAGGFCGAVIGFLVNKKQAC